MNDLFSSENFSWFGRLALAQSFIFFLFLLGLISYSFSIEDVIRPYFIIICIYFWAIYRPSLLSPAYVFALGLLYDFILNYPVGLHAVLFIAAQWIIRDQRLFFLGQPYIIVWMGFGFTCLGVMGLEWLFFSLVSDGVISLHSIFYGVIISTIIFPLVTLLFNVIYRILPPTQQPHLM